MKKIFIPLACLALALMCMSCKETLNGAFRSKAKIEISENLDNEKIEKEFDDINYYLDRCQSLLPKAIKQNNVLLAAQCKGLLTCAETTSNVLRAKGGKDIAENKELQKMSKLNTKLDNTLEAYFEHISGYINCEFEEENEIDELSEISKSLSSLDEDDYDEDMDDMDDLDDLDW